MTEPGMAWKDFLAEYGYYAVSFELNPSHQPSLLELKEWMVTDSPRYTGWSPFWWPTRAEIAPRAISESTYECLHDGTGIVGHIERWRASTMGTFAIVRAYDSDREYEDPGNFLELTLPAWRVGELVLYAGRMANRFEATMVDFTVRYEGLAGRVLRNKAARDRRILLGDYTTHAQRYEKRASLAAQDIESGVIDMTDHLIRGLFELFQFELPAQLCETELTRMRSSRF